MLKLGHIVYSNCFPPHAGIVLKKTAFPFALVEGAPTHLNRLLHEGAIDVSPSSSIEYAMFPGQYQLLPGLSITSKTRVMSILLESTRPIHELGNSVVALTAASATSNVLLRVLLETRYCIRPKYVTYAQGSEENTVRADAILTIGDLAIQKSLSTKAPYRYDLGLLWNEFTGLPFVFALWQVNPKHAAQDDLDRLYAIIKESKAFGLSHLSELAAIAADRFNLPTEVLREYWSLFSYDFGKVEQEALNTFYDLAVQIGAITERPKLRIMSFS